MLLDILRINTNTCKLNRYFKGYVYMINDIWKLFFFPRLIFEELVEITVWYHVWTYFLNAKHVCFSPVMTMSKVTFRFAFSLLIRPYSKLLIKFELCSVLMILSWVMDLNIKEWKYRSIMKCYKSILIRFANLRKINILFQYNEFWTWRWQ